MESSQYDDYWNFYSCHIDDKPHSTMVNISLHDVAPIHGLAIFHCIEINLLHPNPVSGMTTSEESERLFRLEDLIFQLESEVIRYIARQTGDKKRKFYFYSSEEANCRKITQKIESEFPDYSISTFNFEDASWSAYFEDLYPNAMAMNEITNRQVYDRLEAEGDDLSAPRNIDHNVVFQIEKQAQEFAAKVAGMGFKVEIHSTDEGDYAFDLLLQRTDCPAELDSVTFKLEQLADSYGGTYDGWACFAVTGEPPN